MGFGLLIIYLSGELILYVNVEYTLEGLFGAGMFGIDKNAISAGRGAEGEREGKP